MTRRRPLWESVLFSLIRLSPIIAPATILPIFSYDQTAIDLLVKRWLVLLAVLVFWNMTEGGAILWMKAKTHASPNARGFLLVTMLCGAATVAILQYGRTLSSQGSFLLVLAILSIRGMSRSGWEHNRPLAGFLGAIVGNSLITLVSLLCIAPSLDWQSIAVAVAIGSSVGAVEASWYSTTFSREALTRWALPLFRSTLCLGPITIATMGMTNQIPLPYALTSLALPLATRHLRQANTLNEIPSSTLRGAAGIYLLFLAIMMGCKVL
ncbi:MAG: hypothetical protein RL518_138 [Pseudomonadota bacterium]|jgi:hypothetical protein